jgi:hypothetical protein
VLALFLFASPTSALRPNTTLDPCGGHQVTSKEFKDWSSRVWRLIRWERGAPKATTIAAAQEKIHCAVGPENREAMRHHWRYLQRTYFKYRQDMLERQRYTPFDCAGGPSAIPCYITACESGDSYTAQNPSGAYGRYQLMPEWWDYLGRKPTPAEQDRIAADLWAGGAGAGNWLCA